MKFIKKREIIMVYWDDLYTPLCDAGFTPGNVKETIRDMPMFEKDFFQRCSSNHYEDIVDFWEEIAFAIHDLDSNQIRIYNPKKQPSHIIPIGRIASPDVVRYGAVRATIFMWLAWAADREKTQDSMDYEMEFVQPVLNYILNGLEFTEDEEDYIIRSCLIVYRSLGTYLKGAIA